MTDWPPVHAELAEPVNLGLGMTEGAQIAHASRGACSCGFEETAYGFDQRSAHLSAHAVIARHVALACLEADLAEEFRAVLYAPGVATVDDLAARLAARAVPLITRGPSVQNRGDAPSD